MCAHMYRCALYEHAHMYKDIQIRMCIQMHALRDTDTCAQTHMHTQHMCYTSTHAQTGAHMHTQMHTDTQTHVRRHTCTLGMAMPVQAI